MAADKKSLQTAICKLNAARAIWCAQGYLPSSVDCAQVTIAQKRSRSEWRIRNMIETIQKSVVDVRTLEKKTAELEKTLKLLYEDVRRCT